MRKGLAFSILLVITLCNNVDVYAQPDSVKVEYRQESIDSSDYSVRRKYLYLDINQKEEKNLLKLGFKPLTLISGKSYQFATNVLFEKKIFPEWSLISEFELSFISQSIDFFDARDRSKSYKFNIGARYYYGMKKAIREGNSANNFNSNYFELSVMSIPPLSSVTTTVSNNMLSQDLTSTKFHKTALQLAWGIQRRLNNYTFFDTKINVGCKVYPITELDFNELWYVGLDFTIGFGYNMKRK